MESNQIPEYIKEKAKESYFNAFGCFEGKPEHYFYAYEKGYIDAKNKYEVKGKKKTYILQLKNMLETFFKIQYLIFFVILAIFIIWYIIH